MTLGSSRSELQPWSVDAVNLAQHANNPIHTDVGAKAAGFSRALVAGVTTYAYLTHVPAEAWGLEWINSGWAHLRLKRPVFDQDRVELVPMDQTVEAKVDGAIKASIEVGVDNRPEVLPLADSPLSGGELMASVDVDLGPDSYWWRYGQRAGDDLAIYDQAGLVHPAVWPALANHVFHTQVVSGSWIHTESVIVHSASASADATAKVETSIIERGESRLGRTAVADVKITIDRAEVARIRHSALVELFD